MLFKYYLSVAYLYKQVENNFIKKPNSTLSIFLLLLFLVILDRTLFLVNFSFQYVDSDQMIYWQAANDYMKGFFHEPYFYGQNYSFLLEALLSVPFLKLGVPLNYSMPIVTSILSLFPFVLFAFVLYRKSFFVESFVFLAIPIALPIEYEILTSITRGFVTGLFASGFLIFCLIKPHKKSSFILLGSISGLAYILNPNSIIFVLPIGIYMLLKNYKSFYFYIFNIISVTPFLFIEYLSKQFYIHHPEYIVHSMWTLNYSFKTLITAFGHLDNFFSYLTPVVWIWGWIVLLLLAVLGVFLFVKNKKKGLSILISLIFILASLGVNKINDGLNTVFLSPIRMFLGIPLLFGLSIIWTKKYFTVKDLYWKYSIILICCILFCVKASLYKPIIKYHTLTENYGPIAIKKLKQLRCECSVINNIVKEHNIDLIIFLPDWKRNVPYMEFYNYGCPLLVKDFAPTFMNVYERRTWVYKQEKNTVRKNLLIYGYIEAVFLTKIEKNNLIYIEEETTVIRNNTLTTKALLKMLNLTLKRSAYKKFNDYN